MVDCAISAQVSHAYDIAESAGNNGVVQVRMRNGRVGVRLTRSYLKKVGRLSLMGAVNVALSSYQFSSRSGNVIALLCI